MKAIILAGQRSRDSHPGRRRPPPTPLTPVAGTASLVRVLDAVRMASSIDGGVLVGPARRNGGHQAAVSAILAKGDFTWLPPAEGPAESTLKAMDHLLGATCATPAPTETGAQGAPWPALLTTGDHALLTTPTLEAFCSAAAQTNADLVAGLVPYPRVRARFPQMRRTRLRFRDGTYCGANLFYLRHSPAMAAIGLWRKLQSLRKQPWRMAGQLGWRMLAAYALGTLSLDKALAALSDQSECIIGWAAVEDPLAAVDVDSWADHKAAEELLQCKPCC